jgi:hypothetical protein
MVEGGRIYVRRGAGLVPVVQTPYPAEAVLQALLALHPDLLGGDQMTPEEPRRWLVVGREIGVRHEADAGYQWSLDNLFVDQDAIPTLVEVKRATDTRVRREVVAQMLDYAANGIDHWSAEELLEHALRSNAGMEGLVARLGELLHAQDPDADEFFDRVASNLRTGDIRLVFVADEIPSRLRRIVEFLDDQMERAVVLAVEVRQFAGEVAGERVEVLVPRVLGGSETSRIRKEPAARRGTLWNRDTYLERLGEEAKSEAHKALHRQLVPLLGRLEAESQLGLAWGRGSKSASVTVRVRGVPLFSAFSYGSINLGLPYWNRFEPAARVQLERSLAELLARELGEKFPNVAPDLLERDPDLVGFDAWLRQASAIAVAAETTPPGTSHDPDAR